MSICPNCDRRAERPCAHEHQTREYFEVLLPALRYVAYRCGYALAVHGSLKTDIDLVAIPWRDVSPIPAEALAEQLRQTAEMIIGIAVVRPGDKEPTKKPHGRLVFSFYLVPSGYPGPYVDLSVMPREEPKS